jgi:hypothetical protein
LLQDLEAEITRLKHAQENYEGDVDMEEDDEGENDKSQPSATAAGKQGEMEADEEGQSDKSQPSATAAGKQRERPTLFRKTVSHLFSSKPWHLVLWRSKGE